MAELDEAGDDLRNLLAGNEIATIFLDERLRIKWFTPGVTVLFDVIDTDIGRPLANLAQKFTDGDLVGKAKAAIEKLAHSEEEVQSENGKCFSLRVQPYRTRDNRIGGAVASFIDISELKETQGAIAAARDYSEAIVRTVSDPMLVLDEALRVQTASLAFYKMFGVRETDTIGHLVYELGNGQWDIPAFRLLLEAILPERTEVEDYEVEHDFPGIGRRCMLVSARRLAQHAGQPGLILLVIHDITERRDGEKHREMLVGELSHRVKNTLAVVQSIASRTVRRSDSLDNFGEAFLGRLQALSDAHDMIFESGVDRISLDRIVERATRPFETKGEIKIDGGPQFALDPAASQALMLILHELATNAAKYGALSVPNGRVSIGWRSEGRGEARRIRLSWCESGGPDAGQPVRQGQGIRFVKRSAAYELRGAAEFEFEPGGLRATIDIPAATTGRVSARTPGAAREEA